MYHYGFTPVKTEQSLFGDGQKKAPSPSAALDAVLSDKQLPIHRPDRRGGVEKYGNVCCSPACGVTLIRLKNNCQVPLWKQNFERIHEPSYPYVDIIFDNRPGRCLHSSTIARTIIRQNTTDLYCGTMAAALCGDTGAMSSLAMTA